MKRKGQVVRLKSRETGAIIEATVIQYDSIQGYWLKDITSNDSEEYDSEEYVPGEDWNYSDWRWYRLDTWEEVK